MGEKPKEVKPDWEDHSESAFEEFTRDVSEGRVTFPPEDGKDMDEILPELVKPLDPGFPVIRALEDFSEGRERNPNLEKPLDKIFPKLADVVKKMNAIEKEKFWDKIAGNAQTPDAQQRLGQYRIFLHLAKESLLLRACVENWAEVSLLKVYAYTVEKFFENVKDRSKAGSTWLYIKGFGLFPDLSDIARIPGSNPNLITRTMVMEQKARGVTSMDMIKQDVADRLELTRIEQETKKKTLDEWGVDSPQSENQLQFVEETVIPFLRSYFIDRLIIYNKTLNKESIEETQNDYREYLRLLYDSTKMKDLGVILSLLVKIIDVLDIAD